MILAFLSRRFRTWVLFSLLIPVLGRVLRSTGGRVSSRSPRVGGALVSAGEIVQPPRRRRRRNRTGSEAGSA